ncbi:hypothetical protein M427DRAFT_325166 [Gonapodya prolifera JEL478]|uniref:Dienelactone hydrolase domain-containing protein n=1 Tax=Gonapodya prolifera (strain JEL478) TaxID=1344416 RepID=A0A139AF79_GONPJ|nr:hypothetical protein M427DRAFT_325166 [Gonapodya prolifera JEL478]|eukprot:KXS15437.1 hypothetical protein M427DRAFT_325166 [Gonapodya prolifera JEL478]
MEKDDYTVSSSCCGPDTLPTSVVDPSKFKPRGSVVPQAAGTDLNVYVTRPSSGKLRRSDEALLVIYDIVGYGHPNNFQAADVLADKMGLLTVMPDFFRGVPFPPERFDWSGAARLDSPNTVPSPTAGKPAEERNVMGLVRSLDKEIGAWVMRGGGNWDKVVRKDVGDVLGWLKRAHGVKRCAMIGFCYGGVVIVKAAQEFQDTIKAVCGVHPAFMVRASSRTSWSTIG